MSDLPVPTTIPEMYLAALLVELRGLRADLAHRQPPQPPVGQVELREQRPTPRPDERPRRR